MAATCPLNPSPTCIWSISSAPQHQSPCPLHLCIYEVINISDNAHLVKILRVSVAAGNGLISQEERHLRIHVFALTGMVGQCPGWFPTAPAGGMPADGRRGAGQKNLVL